MQQISFRLKPGQQLKEEIEKIVQEKNISAGCIISIVGGLEKVYLRMAGAKPDTQIVKELSGPFEIISGTGTISKNGCHIHIAVSDTEGKTMGGHLKDGCTIKYTAEIVLLIFEDVEYKRTFDEQTGFNELEIN